MKQHGIFNLLYSSILLGALFIFSIAIITPPMSVVAQSGECADGIDNNGDNKADYYGIDNDDDGIIDVEPDPSCFSLDSKVEKDDDVVSKIIPCTNKCSFTDVFKLANNLIVFIIGTILPPLFVLLIMYTGYRYIISQGNPVKMMDFKSLFRNIFFGVLLILCAWLIVVTGLRAIGYTDTLIFFDTVE